MTKEGYIELTVREFKRLKSLGDGAISQISSESFFAIPMTGDNSIAVIVKHVGGNLVSRWTDFLITDGEKPGRDRDQEFQVFTEDTRDHLLAVWEKGWGALFFALEPLSDADLDRTITIRGEPLTVMQAINRQLTHYAYHVGQIVYVAKHHAGESWRSLSIPLGASAQFNKNPAKYIGQIKETRTMEVLPARLQRQFNFLIEIDKLKKIERQNVVSDLSRRENSAEHSWHLALLAIILAEHAAEPLDLFRVVKMLLVHDLVEIDAGDVFVHSPEELKCQAEREQATANRIFAMLPQDQADDLMACWREFEECRSAEAKFAKSLDRVQPALLHEATDGVVWRERGNTKAQIWAVMKGVRENTPALWPKVNSIIEQAAANGHLKT